MYLSPEEHEVTTSQTLSPPRLPNIYTSEMYQICGYHNHCLISQHLEVIILAIYPNSTSG